MPWVVIHRTLAGRERHLSRAPEAPQGSWIDHAREAGASIEDDRCHDAWKGVPTSGLSLAEVNRLHADWRADYAPDCPLWHPDIALAVRFGSEAEAREAMARLRCNGRLRAVYVPQRDFAWADRRGAG